MAKNGFKLIVDAKAQFRFLAEPWANTSTSTERLTLAVLGGLTDVEHDLIRTQTAEGRSRAQKRGQHMGRPFFLQPVPRPSITSGVAIPQLHASPRRPLPSVGARASENRTSCAGGGLPGMAPDQPRSQLTLFSRSPARQLSTLELSANAGNYTVWQRRRKCPGLPQSWRRWNLPRRWRRQWNRGRAGRDCLLPTLDDLSRFGEEIEAGMR